MFHKVIFFMLILRFLFETSILSFKKKKGVSQYKEYFFPKDVSRMKCEIREVVKTKKGLHIIAVQNKRGWKTIQH